MTASLPLLPGLRPIAHAYRGAIVDLWGVMHNGVAAFPAAIEALVRFRETGGRVVLLSNAPRPSPIVMEQLDRLGIGGALYDAIVTSGDLTRQSLEEPGRRDAAIFHIGPDRNESLLTDLAMTRVRRAAEADFIVCTGLYDDHRDMPEDYRELLAEAAAKGILMVCANPDLIVQHGTKIIPCAGGVARFYEGLGGSVEYHGKPHPSVYGRTLDLLGTARRETIAIGDGLETDIRGANAQKIDALLIAGGVHSDLWGWPAEGLKIAAELGGRSLMTIGAIEQLCW